MMKFAPNLQAIIIDGNKAEREELTKGYEGYRCHYYILSIATT